MLNAGTSLCVYCGRTMEKAYYYNADNSLWVILGKTLLGKYGVQQIWPEGFERDESEEYKYFKLTTGIKGSESAIKDSIEVSYTVVKDDVNGNKTETNFNSQKFKRCCPHCCNESNAKNNQSVIRDIWPGMGEVPTYVIAVIGDRAVGKSSWLQALGCVKNQISVKYEYMIKTVELESSRKVFGQSTQLFQDGKSKMLIISTRGDDARHVANVLFLDFPGEIFDKNNRAAFEQSPAYRLFTGTESYSGVDAVIFMDDANEDDDRNVIKAYNSVAEFGLLKNKPVAYVLNKIDLRMKALQKKRNETSDAGSELMLSILTEDTFKCGDQDYSKSVLLPRICLETAIATKLRSFVEYIISNNSRSAGFLIKSAEPIKQGNSSDSKALGGTDISLNRSDEAPDASKNDEGFYNDFEKPINVMDPLIWILNELDIFPIE